jgi:hypothetical protein
MRSQENSTLLATRLLVALIASTTLGAQTNSYTQTNIASDVPGMAKAVDPEMINPWGLGRYNGQGWWFVADAATGMVTVIDGDAITWSHYFIPSANGQGTGSPAGMSGGPNVTATTLDGTIQENMGNAIIEVNNSGKGAVYTGCTWAAPSKQGPLFLYVANSAGGVEGYDEQYHSVSLPPGAFTDPNIPAGFTPYGIQSTAFDKVWVTFFNGTPGGGQGYVDEFDSSGNLLLRLQRGSWMNQPWGVAQAPANFGAFSGALLVAMTGNGSIAVFNPATGQFRGVLKDSSGQPTLNPGIHGIAFGDSVFTGPKNYLYFTAGIDNFTHGLFGFINAN